MKNYKPGTLFIFNKSNTDIYFCAAPPGNEIISKSTEKMNVDVRYRIKVVRGDYLLFIQEYDWIEKLKAAPESPVINNLHPRATRAPGAQGLESYDEPRKISGGILMTPNGKLIWTSCRAIEKYMKIINQI